LARFVKQHEQKPHLVSLNVRPLTLQKPDPYCMSHNYSVFHAQQRTLLSYM